MARHRDQTWIEVDGRRVTVTPRARSGKERARAREGIAAQSPRFAGQQR